MNSSQHFDDFSSSSRAFSFSALSLNSPYPIDLSTALASPHPIPPSKCPNTGMHEIDKREQRELISILIKEKGMVRGGWAWRARCLVGPGFATSFDRGTQ